MRLKESISILEKILMIYNLYLYLLHWLMDSLPKVDDNYIKCAQCGWESEHINNLKFIYIGDNTMEGLCPNCYNDRIYHKRDWSDLKANSIPLTFKVYFKGDENDF